MAILLRVAGLLPVAGWQWPCGGGPVHTGRPCGRRYRNAAPARQDTRLTVARHSAPRYWYAARMSAEGPLNNSTNAMVVTDLDGTLLDSRGILSQANRAVLERLGRDGVVRVVATGRNLHSALRVMTPDTPIDYLVFASGAGTMEWRTRTLLHSQHLDEAQALDAAARLIGLGLDFMLHAAVPDNHHFWYHRVGPGNADFERRVHRNRDFGAPWPDAAPAGPFSQLLAVQARAGRILHEELAVLLAPLNVVRTTSPLDHESYWFEVFAPGVSKAAGAARVLDRHGIDPARVLAVGNDFNDEALLAWAPHPRVVANAPRSLRERYPNVPSNDEDGFAAAVGAWLSS